MPYKDDGTRIEAVRRWRRARTDEYNKWLYARRKLRFDKAQRFEETLNAIAALEDRGLHSGSLAREVLLWALRQEILIGNRFNHETNVSYYKEEE